jgi:hypothetical protein
MNKSRYLQDYCKKIAVAALGKQINESREREEQDESY